MFLSECALEPFPLDEPIPFLFSKNFLPTLLADIDSGFSWLLSEREKLLGKNAAFFGC